MAVTREPNFTFQKSREKCRREKCLLGRNVAPDIFDQKSREKSKSGRNVAGRNVAGRNVSQGEMSFSRINHVRTNVITFFDRNLRALA